MSDWPDAAPVGSSVLVYRYTVAGSDKSSIDTDVDTADAGSNDFTNGDMLEIIIYGRTDEAVVLSAIYLTFNNDSGATQYAYSRIRQNNSVVSGAENVGNSAIGMFGCGANATANVFGVVRCCVPNFMGTVGYKAFESTGGQGSASAGQNDETLFAGVYKSTAAITRVKIAPIAGKNLKVGTQLLIYKRTAS